jgi:hypothetical protein
MFASMCGTFCHLQPTSAESTSTSSGRADLRTGTTRENEVVAFHGRIQSKKACLGLSHEAGTDGGEKGQHKRDPPKKGIARLFRKPPQDNSHVEERRASADQRSNQILSAHEFQNDGLNDTHHARVSPRIGEILGLSECDGENGDKRA